ncbi:hypothetical protein LP416_26265 [Polaromonas sp. P2-4]|nr:hypothetical protein LP416_26265 [Polaromonas sp. P2-4]
MKASLQLVEDARTGNTQAIAQLLLVCQPDLKRFARRTCSTTEDAEDAVQLALWQLYLQNRRPANRSDVCGLAVPHR